MQKLFFILFFITSFSVLGQYQISGNLTDNASKKPLPFANVLSAQGAGTITDRDGNFTLEQTEPFTTVTFSYIGYNAKVLNVTTGKTYYTVTLTENVESLGEVVLLAKDNPAIQIIKNTIENKKQNNPEKALKSFEFNTYSKLLVTANPDSISGTIDTIYKVTNGKKQFMLLDSTNYELKKQLEKSHLYISEKVSEYKFNQAQGKRENILATRMAGLEEPFYRVLAIQMQSFTFYEDEYTVFGTSYSGPIANNALKQYDYRILDTIPATNNSNSAYLIYYKPKKTDDFAGLQGVLYIDTKTYALHKAVAQLKGTVNVNAEQNFVYVPKDNVWFPKSKKLVIEKGENNQAVSLFGGRIKITEDTAKDSTIVHSNATDGTKELKMIMTEQNSNILINTPIDIKGRGLAIAFEDDAFKKDDTFWNLYRTDSITTRGKETYRTLDSLVKAEGFEKKMNFFLKFTNGYIATKYVDLDLKYLIKYNNHEGFRLGMGAITNKNFSTKYRLHGYTVYGTKDRKFKYGFGGEARLNKFTNTWLGAGYSNDLQETGSHSFITDGRAFYVFQPRLFNITTFQQRENFNVNFSHNITSKARLKIQLDRNAIDPLYDYTFHVNGKDYTTYNTTTATAAVSWQPYSTFMLTPDGFDQINRGFPTFTFQAIQGIAGVLGSDFNFTKLNFRAYYQVTPLNKGTSSFTFNSGLALGELPITELFHTNPNNPNKGSIMRRFSVAGIDNFETMYFNEFFSDKYITAQARHEFKQWPLTKHIKPQLSLFSKFAIGDVSNTYRHTDFMPFKSLKHGYMESGLELNSILYGFGLSAAYRYGYYHLPKFDDNISFKFTYNFNLKF